MLRGRPRISAGAICAVLLGLLTAGLADLATQSLILGIAGVVLAGGLAVVAVFGTEATGFGSLMLATFLGPMDGLRLGGLLTAADVFYLLGFMMLLPRRAAQRITLPAGFGLAIAGLAAVTLLTTIGSSAHGESANEGIRLFYATVLLPLGIALYRPSIVRIDLMAWAYVVGEMVNTVAAFVGPEAQGRRIGLTQHPDYLGMDGSFGCALALYLATRPGRQYDRQRPYAWAAGAVCAICVLISGSRTALLAVFVIAVFYPIVERTFSSVAILAVGGITGIFSMAWLAETFGTGSALTRLFNGGLSSSYSDQARSQNFHVSWVQYMKHPIWGEGFRKTDYLTHNVLLQIPLALGIPGLIFFLLMIATLVRILFVGGRLRGLGYVAIAYASMLPTTPAIWDRNIWSALVLAVLATGAYTHRTDLTDPAHTPAELPPPPPSAGWRTQLERHR